MRPARSAYIAFGLLLMFVRPSLAQETLVEIIDPWNTATLTSPANEQTTIVIAPLANPPLPVRVLEDAPRPSIIIGETDQRPQQTPEAAQPAPSPEQVAARSLTTLEGWQRYLDRFPEQATDPDILIEMDIALLARMIALSGNGNAGGVARASIRNTRPFDLSRNLQSRIERDLGVTTETVRQVQRALNSAGFDTGTPDGVAGPRTRAQLQSYQVSNNMPATGVISPFVLSSLGLDPQNADYSGLAANGFRPARPYDPDALAVLYDDPRLIRAADVLDAKGQWNWGYYDGRLYITISMSWPGGFMTMSGLAQNAGGELVSITSRAERNFIIDLIEDDPSFFSPLGAGPTIGLLQAPGSREPDGGWEWLSGEPFSYQDWRRNEPNDRSGQGNPERYAIISFDRERESIGAAGWNDTSGTSHSFIIEIN